MKKFTILLSICLFLFINQANAQTFTNYTTEDGLVGNWIQGIAIDKKGNKWFCAGGEGVSKFDGVNWTSYTTADGLADSWVDAIAIDSEGNKWFATNWGGVSKFNDTTWITYTTEDGLANNTVLSMAIDGEGNKWFGTGGGGVSKFDGTTWSTYTTEDGLADNWVGGIAIDTEGNVWFATGEWDWGYGVGGGVSKFDGNNWTTYTTEDGLADGNFARITADSKGNIWVGIWAHGSDLHGGGISKFDGSTWTTYTNSDYPAIDDYVCAITIDSMGNKWFGTKGEGVLKFDDTNWTAYTTEDGLAGNEVRAIAIDEGGNLWFGTELGVSKLSLDLVGWWPFNGNANDESGNGNNGIVYGATLTTDRFGDANNAYYFDGIGDLITIQNSATLCPPHYTLSAWFKFTTDNQNNKSILSKAFSDAEGISYGIYYDNNQLTGIYGSGSKLSYPATFIKENWYHVLFICDTNLNITKLYLNGIIVTDGFVNENTVYDTLPLLIGAESDSSGLQKYFEGSIDDIRIYKRAISESEVQNLYHEGNWANPAIIKNSLNDQLICKNSNASLEVKANGTPPIHYQWQKYGTDITRDTNSTLIIDDFQNDDAGNYRCIAFNDYGADTSNTAKLTTDFVAPDSLMLYCTFDVVSSIINPVTGPGGTFNANPETNFTTGQIGNAYMANYMEDKLVIFPKEVIPFNRGCIEFWAKLTDMPEYISLGTSPGFFWALPDPYGEMQYMIMFNGNDGWGGAGLTARAGVNSAGYAAASSTGCWWYGYTYASILGDVNAWHHYALSWDICGVPGSQYKMQIYLDGIPIGDNGINCDGGERTPINLDQLTSGALYILDFMYMEQGSAAIDELKIWNYPKTQFIEQAYIYTVLNDQQICKNNNATFEVRSVGIPPIQYQWQKDGADITGETDSILTISSVQPGDKGEYRCIASNSYGIDTSNSAMLWIEFAEPTDIQGFTYIPEYQVAIYSVEIQQGHTYHFIVEGGNKIDSTGNSVTVHWGKPGQGRVKLIETSEIGCDAETNILNLTIGSTGIKDQLTQNLLIYPNPVKDNLIIKCDYATLSEITISVVDISGRRIIQREFEHIDLGDEQVLDLSSIKSGIYFLEIKSEMNSRVYKIIKE